jgi:hypothetical protein
VSALTVDGHDYVVAGFEGSDWVQNVRSAGWGYLAQGRVRERVSLVELAPTDRGRILRWFPLKVPHGVSFFTRLYGVSADPDQFEALSDRCPVFRVERITG